MSAIEASLSNDKPGAFWEDTRQEALTIALGQPTCKFPHTDWFVMPGDWCPCCGAML